jgi:hypothetical protein
VLLIRNGVIAQLTSLDSLRARGGNTKTAEADVIDVGPASQRAVGVWPQISSFSRMYAGKSANGTPSEADRLRRERLNAKSVLRWPDKVLKLRLCRYISEQLHVPIMQAQDE